MAARAGTGRTRGRAGARRAVLRRRGLAADRREFEIGGVEVLWPRRLVKRVTGAAGELNVGRVVEVLSARFPAA